MEKMCRKNTANCKGPLTVSYFLSNNSKKAWTPFFSKFFKTSISKDERSKNKN